MQLITLTMPPLSPASVIMALDNLTTLLWHCWLGGGKGIRPVKNRVVGCWRGCVWVKVQICIWVSWCHCHSLSLAPVNPDWLYLSGNGSPG